MHHAWLHCPNRAGCVCITAKRSRLARRASLENPPQLLHPAAAGLALFVCRSFWRLARRVMSLMESEQMALRPALSALWPSGDHLPSAIAIHDPWKVVVTYCLVLTIRVATLRELHLAKEPCKQSKCPQWLCTFCHFLGQWIVNASDGDPRWTVMRKCSLVKTGEKDVAITMVAGAGMVCDHHSLQEHFSESVSFPENHFKIACKNSQRSTSP